MDDDNKISFFFLGLGLGVAVGLLFAPKSGSETRELIANKAGEGKDFLRRSGEQLRDSASDVLEKSKDVVARQRDQISNAIEAGKQAYRDALNQGGAGSTPQGV